jgi:hypothetical protein
MLGSDFIGLGFLILANLKTGEKMFTAMGIDFLIYFGVRIMSFFEVRIYKNFLFKSCNYLIKIKKKLLLIV